MCRCTSNVLRHELGIFGRATRALQEYSRCHDETVSLCSPRRPRRGMIGERCHNAREYIFFDSNAVLGERMDPRIERQRYGKVFLESLPPYRLTRDIADVENFFVER